MRKVKKVRLSKEGWLKKSRSGSLKAGVKRERSLESESGKKRIAVVLCSCEEGVRSTKKGVNRIASQKEIIKMLMSVDPNAAEHAGQAVETGGAWKRKNAGVGFTVAKRGEDDAARWGSLYDTP